MVRIPVALVLVLVPVLAQAQQFSPTNGKLRIGQEARRRRARQRAVLTMRRISFAVALALGMVPATASAQQFAPVESPLRVGKRVYVVVDAPCAQGPCAGEFVDGRVTSLNADTIVVESDGRRFELPAVDVRRVETYGDPVWNGMAYGFAFTFGAAYLATSNDCRGGGWFCEQGWIVAAASVCGGVGAAVGAIADAMISGRKVVFQRDGRASIAPLIGRGGGGVRVSVRF